MWKKLHNSLPYYMLFIQEQKFDISISDYVKIWTVEFNVDEFTSCLKDSNLGLEIDTNELVTNGVQMLTHPESLKAVNISCDGQHLKVSLTKSFGYPLKITTLFKLGSHELFFQKITQPLLKTIQDLRSSESELRFLLISKDKEIEEYKAEAGEICLRYLKTKPYNDEAHMEKHTLYDIHFGSCMSESLLEKSLEIPKERIIKQENIEVKTEASPQLVKMDMQVIPDDVKIKQEVKNEPDSSVTVKKRKIKLNI